MSRRDRWGHLHLSWDDTENLNHELAAKLQGLCFDAYLNIACGGNVPSRLLRRTLRWKGDVLTAHISGYDGRVRRERPIVQSFPEEPKLVGRTILVIDDVHDSGYSHEVALARIRHAGSTPIMATYFYKPSMSVVSHTPDFYAATTDDWIVFPWEEGEDDFAVDERVRVKPGCETVLPTLLEQGFTNTHIFTVAHVRDDSVILQGADGRYLQYEGEDLLNPAWFELAA